MKISYKIAATAALLLLSPAALAQSEKNDPETIFKDGKFFGELRYRYENVDQNNALEDANAHTVRANIGFETGIYRGLKGLVEGQVVKHFANEDFNALDNRQTNYSVVADPDTAEINRLWIEYTDIPSTSLKIGRQFLNWDNQRFIGTVGWRQNDQTFDAISLFNNSIEKLSLRYSYVHKVNRIFEGSTPPDDLEGNIHLANISYKFADWLNVGGYGYWMDFDNEAGLTAATANQSNRTFGIRAHGKVPIDENWNFSYEAEAATQEDHGSSTINYDENYYHIAPKISGHGFTFGIGYEILEGDGTNAFRTPLATLHKFNGWADTFLNTPANGLKDAYGLVSYQFSQTNSIIDGTELTAVYHDYEGYESGDFGSEWNLSIGKTFIYSDNIKPFNKFNVLLKYADYDAQDAPYVDTQKIWLQVGIKF